MPTRTLFIGLLLFTALGPVGCATLSTVEPGRPIGQRQMVTDLRIVNEPGLSFLQILGVNTSTGPEGFLKIQVEIQNVSGWQQSFTHRVEWFDASGMVIPLPTTTPIPMTLQSGETKYLTATAPTPRAKDFRLKLFNP